MRDPAGQNANNADQVMTQATWVNHIESLIAQGLSQKEIADGMLKPTQKTGYLNLQNKPYLIKAGMGRPTYPASVAAVLKKYFSNIEETAKKERQELENTSGKGALDYGDPQGDEANRKMMATAMSNWYDAPISPQDILFTVGGAGGLHLVFEVLNQLNDNVPFRMITPFPHYSLYASNPGHKLHPIDVFKLPGYKLTAEAIEASIIEAYEAAKEDHIQPKAILICNPNNPMGTVIDAEEMKKIAVVLKKYPDLRIIFDEAYTEMNYVRRGLLEILEDLLKENPDLKIILDEAHEKMGMEEKVNFLNLVSALLLQHKLQNEHLPELRKEYQKTLDIIMSGSITFNIMYHLFTLRSQLNHLENAAKNLRIDKSIKDTYGNKVYHSLSKLTTALEKDSRLPQMLEQAQAIKDKENASLAKLAPELVDRIIIMRSATKAFSAAGERLAVLMAFDPVFMRELKTLQINTVGHAPRSLQKAYAETMANLNEREHLLMKYFYKAKVDYVTQRARQMGITLPSAEYHTEGTFYVPVDLSELFGMKIPKGATKALEKEGVVSNDLELAYSLLYKDLLSISPFSYCGVDGKKGYMRITCCSPQDELCEMMDRIEKRILKVRLEKNKKMRHEIEQLLYSYESIETTYSRTSLLTEPSSKDRWGEQSSNNELSLSSSQEEERSSIEDFAREIRIRYQNIHKEKQPNARCVQKENKQLENILSELRPAIMRATRLGQRIAARKIKNFLSHNFLTRKDDNERKKQQREEDAIWKRVVDKMFVIDCPQKDSLLCLTREKRMVYAEYAEAINKLENTGNLPQRPRSQ